MNGTHLLVRSSSDSDTVMELWSLDESRRIASLTIAGSPALTAVSDTGARVAVADFDRAIRVWDTASGELLAQIGLDAQPGSIEFSAGGSALGVGYGEGGVSLWGIDNTTNPLFEIRDEGRWQLVFSPSGTSVLAGNATRGYQVYSSKDGGLLGPSLGPSADGDATILAFSEDEQTVVTSDKSSLRFWRVPVAPVLAESAIGEQGHPIWNPSGKSVTALSPNAKLVAVGDRDGDVHILPVAGGYEAMLEAAGQVSFLGHNAAVRLLRMNDDGSLSASAAADNSVRIWNTDEGDPRPFSTEIPGNAITRMVFSADSSSLAVLNGNRAQIVDAASGEILAGFELGENHSAIAFSGNDSVYVGGDSGSLRIMQRDNSGSWSMQTVWQGASPLRWLEASPRGDYLVVVDADNRASQFHLQDGKHGEMVLQLPSPVTEVRFSPGGSRVMFRTSRWVHRASSSAAGLHWLKTAYGPGALPGSRIVFGDSQDAQGRTAFVPVADARFIRVAELAFGPSESAGLFGSRDDLLDEWNTRLGAVPVD